MSVKFIKKLEFMLKNKTDTLTMPRKAENK